MRLLRLSLKDWCGIESRQIVFSDAVTLIEGPNEVGKSTMVHAIRLLFNEFDSSKKQSVKVVQPVNRDVGSTVEVEVKSGPYHFVYSKTYNKSAQTTLSILAPRKKQVTGREAHEAAGQMLAETVDMALWEALLVDQGEKVALANIQNSASLAKALDAAAGTAATGDDETDLYESVRAEYERYFTLKTGKPRFTSDETAFTKAHERFEEAQQSLGEVEATALSHERTEKEVRRIGDELPRLQQLALQHDKAWQAVRTLRETVDAKDRHLADARVIDKAARDAAKSRADLVDDVVKSEVKVADACKELEPLQRLAEESQSRSRSAQQAIADLRTQVKAARAAFDLAHSDEQYLADAGKLRTEETRLKQIQEVASNKLSALQTVASIKIDDAALEQLRQAESRAIVARGTRNTAATTISITAQDNLVVEIDGNETSLRPDKPETRTVASPARICIPGIADIVVTPPLSVGELQAELEESEEALAQLLRKFEVSSLKDAVAANERRTGAQRDVEQLKARENELLDGASVVEIEEAISTYRAEGARYAAERQSRQDLPADLPDASSRVSKARVDVASREAALEKAQEKSEALQQEYSGLDARLRVAEQNLAGFQLALVDNQQRLVKARDEHADMELVRRATDAAATVVQLEKEAAELRVKLNESTPEAVEALSINAQSALERARENLVREEQNLAVLADRLKQAQADGRYEAREAAERDLAESRRTLESIRQRSAAIALLWTSLTKHRDAARKAYVRPLKDSIEHFGRIVFGGSFEIEMGDDWTVHKRTLNGITLPFESLSVGAKEQIGIIARLAAAQIVSRHGGVPLIIDDALGFSDPSRLETIGAAIAAAGKDAQIIILTCSPGRFTHVGTAEVVRF